MDRKTQIPQPPLEDVLQDLLRTQIRIGMDQAAEMLSRFLQPRYHFRIRLTIAKAEPAPPQAQTQAGVSLQIEGAVAGAVLLLFSAKSACRLAGLLLRK